MPWFGHDELIWVGLWDLSATGTIGSFTRDALSFVRFRRFTRDALSFARFRRFTRDALSAFARFRRFTRDALSFARFRRFTRDALSFARFRRFTRDALSFPGFRRFTRDALSFARFRRFTRDSLSFACFRRFTRDALSFARFRRITRDALSFARFRRFTRDALSFPGFRRFTRDALSFACFRRFTGTGTRFTASTLSAVVTSESVSATSRHIPSNSSSNNFAPRSSCWASNRSNRRVMTSIICDRLTEGASCATSSTSPMSPTCGCTVGCSAMSAIRFVDDRVVYTIPLLTPVLRMLVLPRAAGSITALYA